MKNLIIFSENNKFTVDLFTKKFLNKSSLNLKCIIATENGYDLIRNNFDNIDIFNFSEFEKNKIKIKNKNINELDQNILEENIDIEILSNKLLDFYNPNGNKFSLREIRHSYYSSLVFSLNCLYTYNPDVVFFSNVPHSYNTIILALICKKKGIKTIFKREISIPGRFIFQNDLFDCSLNDDLILEENHQKIVQENSLFFKDYENNLKENNQKEISKIFSKKRDHYLINKINLVKNFSLIFIFFFIFRQIILHIPKMVIRFSRDIFLYLLGPKNKYKNRIFLEDHWKSSNNLLKDSSTYRIYRDFELLKGDIRKYNLLKKYCSLTKNINQKKKFIYFALHYQPEATTYPFGNYFIDQIVAIKLLSAHIPDDYTIYVKEHPDIFNIGRESWVIGDFARDFNYYNELASIKNVQLVPLETSSLELISNSQAISTIAGAVGLEAILKGKPVLLFGYPWYEKCEGAYIVSSHKKCKNSVDHLINKKKLEESRIKSFFQKACSSIFNDSDLYDENKLDYIQKKFLEKLN